jgi:hypothetical protein
MTWPRQASEINTKPHRPSPLTWKSAQAIYDHRRSEIDGPGALQDAGTLWRSGGAEESAARGSENQNVEPCPSMLSTPTLP